MPIEFMILSKRQRVKKLKHSDRNGGVETAAEGQDETETKMEAPRSSSGVIRKEF